MRVEIVDGPGAGTLVPVTGPLEVGREGSGLRLDDPQASRRHARLTATAGGVSVEDLGSTNGTFVNDAQVAGVALARPGDRILVGLTVLEVRADSDERPSGLTPRPGALATGPRQPDYLKPSAADGGNAIPELDPLLDSVVKARARTAPLAVAALAALAIIAFLAQR
jgi:hypothetical protein